MADMHRPETLGRPPGRRPGHLYENVKAELRRRIAGGVYAPGARIPSERQLTEQFAVSAITIRRAIRDLALDGVLLARQGLGVFVADNRPVTRALTTDIMTTLEDDMRRAGISLGLKVLSLGPVADSAMAARLQLPAGSQVYRLRKVILGDDSPVVVDTAFLPLDLARALHPDITEERFLFPLLVTHQVAVDHVRFRVTGDTASPENALTLALPPNFSTLVLDYTVVGPDAIPVLTGQAVSRADRLGYEFDVHPGLHRTDLRSQVRASASAGPAGCDHSQVRATGRRGGTSRAASRRSRG
jgi:DNA-binding GntR family transcriptional regulator